MNKKILSMFLALCMVVTLLPVSAMAEEIHTTIGTSGEITSFAPLAETEKTVSLGTSSENLELPETLTATVRTAVPSAGDSVQDSGSPETATPTTAAEPEWEETTVDIPVKWESTLEYDMDAEGEYVFTPVIGGYDVRAELPEITVTVDETLPIAAAFGLVAPLSATTYDIWVGGVQVTDGNKDDVLGDGTVTYDPTNSTLTLRNANINYGFETTPAISVTNDLTIVAEGTNAVSASGHSAAIYNSSGNLTLKGSGALTAVSNQNLAVQASNITVGESITLTAVGGATTESQPGGEGLYAFNDLEIKDTARVTAVGGKSPAGSPFSAGIRAGENVTIGGDATVTGVGGDTVSGGYSAGISASASGTITIGGSAKVVAVGGNAGTNASYGLYANDGSGTGSITYSGGLLVAKGGKGATSLAMNQLLEVDTLADIVITTAADVATNASKYCVVSPKTDDTAVYRVVTEGLSTSAKNETPGHIEWSGNNLTLTDTVVIAPVGTGTNVALNMSSVSAGATLTLGGFNVLLAGDTTATFSVALEGGGTYSDLTITGSGDLTAISGSGYQCYGILNTKNLSSTGAITAIAGGGYTISHGISNFYPLSISTGKVIAIGSESDYGSDSYGIYKSTASDGAHSVSGGSGVAVGRKSALNTAPTTTGLITMGASTGKAMAWGPMPPPAAASATPAADVTTVTKASSTQASVAFTLTNDPVYADGLIWKVYANPTGKQNIDGSTYTFDQYGVTADVPKNLRYTTYTVQKGDSFWSIAHKLICTMSELERLNNKSRFTFIHPGDVFRVPEK